MQLTAQSGYASITFPRFVVPVLPKKLSERIKRVIFVYSVMATLDKSRYANLTIINEINSRLKLARAESLCKATLQMHKSIWKYLEKDMPNDISIRDIATTRLERDLISDYYVRNCPSWLVYGSDDRRDMVRDLHRLFNALVTRSL